MDITVLGMFQKILQIGILEFQEYSAKILQFGMLEFYQECSRKSHKSIYYKYILGMGADEDDQLQVPPLQGADTEHDL